MPISAEKTTSAKTTQAALRARLAGRRASRLRAPGVDAAAVADPAQGAEPAPLADVAGAKIEGHELTDQGFAPGAPAEPRDIVKLPFAEPDVPATGAEPVVLPGSFLPLSVLDRIGQPSVGRDLTLLYAVLIVFFLHAGALVGAIRIAESSMPDLDAMGQVENPKSIAVELVEAADANAKDKVAQIGDEKPPEEIDRKKELTEASAPSQPQPEPPQQARPPQQQSQAQPQQQEQKEQKQEPQKQAMLQPKEQQREPKEQTSEQAKPEKPLKLQQTDEGSEAPLVEYDFAAGDPAVRVNPNPAARASEAQDPREARSPNAPDQAPNVAQQRLAASLQGKESLYRKAVLKKLALSKPQIWTNPAEVRITFVVSPSGEPVHIRMLQSSNDRYFDDVAVEWIKRAHFDPPPPNAKAEDLVYLIHYTIH